jgi:glycosyltransferase involved in cell wall biosynthesis
MEIKISVIVIVKNEEEKIATCLNSVTWADEVIVVDNGSTDKTTEIVKKFKVKLFSLPGAGFSELRNYGLAKAQSRWILYVDADEQIPSDLATKIQKVISVKPTVGYYAIPRRNIILGREMKHGGWWPDYVKRLFVRKNLIRWTGELHEEPNVVGEMGYLKEAIIHTKYNNLSEMITKTNKWSAIEAKLLYDANHPPMVWWRFLRIMISELWLRLIANRGVLDGTEGIIYAFYQMWSRFITYGKLWEMQQ